MDAIKTSGTDIIRTAPDGSIIRFPRLRLLADLAPMLAELQAAERVKLLAAMNDAKMPPADRAKALIDFDRDQYSMSKGILWSYTPAGTAKTLLRSLQRINPAATDADVDALPLSIDDMRTISGELWGNVTVAANSPTAVREASEAKTDPSDPPKAGTPQTGS